MTDADAAREYADNAPGAWTPERTDALTSLMGRLIAAVAYDQRRQTEAFLAGVAHERERAARVIRAFRGGYTASLSGDCLVPDPDGPWALPADIAAAIRTTPE